jgi:hypothetical protein
MRILWFLFDWSHRIEACQKENEEREFHEVFTSPELIITDEGVHVSYPCSSCMDLPRNYRSCALSYNKGPTNYGK